VASRHAAATGDLITHGESGFVVDPRDRPSFAETLTRALRLSDPARIAMVARASARLPADDSIAVGEAMVSYARHVVQRRALHSSRRALPDP
jgi:hypothetical protein